jgi:molybdopterin converting factor small subunit
MEIRLKLFPPLSDTAGVSEMDLSLGDQATIQSVVDALVSRFGPAMEQHLFDRSGRIIPSWAVFLNRKIYSLNQPQSLEVSVHPRDEVSFILNIAGG